MLLPWLILWIPFAAAAGISLFLIARPKAAAFVATAGMFAAFALSLALFPVFFEMQKNGAHALESSFQWMLLGQFSIEFGVLFNGLTFLMLLIVTGIGSLIFLYSMTYMAGDPAKSRYFASLSLFAFSMLGIVLSNNLIQIFIFWELVGLSSYLLIGFWLEKPEAATAGKKAFLTTRVGDVGMMIGILTLFGFLAKEGVGTFNFIRLEHLFEHSAAMIPAGWMTFITLGLFAGVVGKSAQAPLHVWLPDAMEGPTPVSALIHAATMVAAGIFLLARLIFLFELSPATMQIIIWIGTITAFLAATIAVVQDDIKKILAYSTLSQLGYMAMALGQNSPEAGMFHLTTHAFFKALLFLGAGSLIHAFHTQNIWEMKTPQLIKKMPVTAVTFLIATFALMGIPPLSGFYSKEAVLAAAAGGPQPVFWISLVVVFLTAFYMGRLLVALFAKSNRPDSHAHVHESDWRMSLPLLVLGICSIFGGFLPIADLFGHSASGHHGDSSLVYLSLGFALSGFLLSWLFYSKRPDGLSGMLSVFKPFDHLLKHKYFFDDLYDLFIRYVQDNIARVSDLFERWIVVEGAVNGTAKGTRGIGDILRKLQTGSVQFYVLLFAGGFTFLVYLLILGGKL